MNQNASTIQVMHTQKMQKAIYGQRHSNIFVAVRTAQLSAVQTRYRLFGLDKRPDEKTDWHRATVTKVESCNSTEHEKNEEFVATEDAGGKNRICITKKQTDITSSSSKEHEKMRSRYMQRDKNGRKRELPGGRGQDRAQAVDRVSMGVS